MTPRLLLTPYGIDERKAAVSKRSGLTFGDALHPDVVQGIVVDFFTYKHSVKKLLAVCKDAKPVTEFRKRFPYLKVTHYRLDWFSGQDVTQPPKKLMAMLLASSQRHFVLLNTVFGQLWREIVVYLKDWSVCMNFANALSQFTNKKPVIVNHYRERQRRAAICAVVTTAVSMAWMRSRKEELPEYSISDRQFSEILGRLERYPKYVERRKMWTNTIISYLISQSQSIPQRRARLEEALSQEGLELRKDSQFCKEFIEKPLCIEVEEVVAIMEITSDIFSYGHIAWSNLHSEMEVAVLKQVFENGMGWMEAVRAVTTSADYYKKVQRESEKRGRDDDDEDDYFDWERGGRSRGRWY